MNSVAALILTFDAPESVVECVRVSLAQDRPPEEILVLDNAGATLAERSLDEAGLLLPGVTVLRADANLGPAGGYAAALEWFAGSAHDVAWVMDDDCRPEPDALGYLEARAAQEPKPTVVFPQEIDGADGSTLNNPSWSGVWLPREVVETVGLPRADFVWWMEDTEYLRLRMRAHGIPVVRDAEARVVQSRARRGGDPPVWKVYYETRNSAYVRFHIKNRAAMGVWIGRMARRLGVLLVREQMRAAKLGAFVQGLADGIRGRLGKRFPLG